MTRNQRRIFGIGFLLSTLLLAGGPRSWAETAIPKEYQIKAVFLFNFAQFVKWPPAAFANAGEPFRIGILGEDPFDGFLDETVRDEKVNGHPLVIQRYGRVEDAKGCQVLFISRSESQREENILAGLKGRNILTVGDREGFIKDGGMVRFYMKENKIHLRINLQAAKHAHLSISSKVLRLAEIARPGED
jgi:hypothetical protein